jgi:predicted phage terminase large subunit-like protein
LLEDADLGRGIVQDLRRSSSWCTPIAIPVRIEKIARMQARAVMFEMGKVYLPHATPWLGAYLAELLGFPNSRYTDQVDSTSQALDFLQQRFAEYPARRQERKRPASNVRPRGAR